MTSRPNYSTLREACMGTWESYGWRGFYQGVVPNCLGAGRRSRLSTLPQENWLWCIFSYTSALSQVCLGESTFSGTIFARAWWWIQSIKLLVPRSICGRRLSPVCWWVAYIFFNAQAVFCWAISWCTGAVSLIISNPIWVVKTRMCLQLNGGIGIPDSKRYAGVGDALVKIYSYEGWRGLYKVPMTSALYS